MSRASGAAPASRDEAELRRAFTSLLTHPVLDRRRHPDLFALVRAPSLRPVLTDWFGSRLGYRLVVADSTARLFRLPLLSSAGMTVVAPRRFGAPSRRVLVLALLAASAAEDAADVTTTQDLSDRVRALSAHDEVDLEPYEPDRFAERQVFVKAVDVLVGVGALRPIGRDAEEQREGWAHRRDAVGGGYEVVRDLLLRMVDPVALDAALGARPARDEPVADSTARFGLMRRLIELPVCLFADLTNPERAYLASQRHRILGWCTQMTGWVVEQRAEGLALIATDDSGTDLPFPRPRSVDFVALMILDELRRRSGGDGSLGDEDVDWAATEVRARYPKAMTKELESDLAVRDRAVELLRALDLLRPATVAGRWWLSPAAARFRDPRVVAVTRRLDDQDDG
ncbi:MAG: TIGR02678 family protein [Frankia sp.]